VAVPVSIAGRPVAVYRGRHLICPLAFAFGFVNAVMLADDILALLKKGPMTSEELAKELGTTETEVLISLYAQLKGRVEIGAGGKWKCMPPNRAG